MFYLPGIPLPLHDKRTLSNLSWRHGHAAQVERHQRHVSIYPNPDIRWMQREIGRAGRRTLPNAFEQGREARFDRRAFGGGKQEDGCIRRETGAKPGPVEGV
ncbi:MAG: hypothetical protein R3E84_02300 [Pseudomonadales bacterium]